MTNDTATEVELVCEMAGFIRPDEDLQWFRIDGVLSSKNGERYTVTYREGQSNSAQNGGTETVPSRLSVLTVSRPQQSDSGVFECRLNEIALSAEIRLTVLGKCLLLWPKLELKHAGVVTEMNAHNVGRINPSRHIYIRAPAYQEVKHSLIDSLCIHAQYF